MTSDDGLYIVRFCAWAPGIDGPGEWDEWAQGKRDISFDGTGPGLGFTEPLFRRRLSQISRMTVQVVHGLLPLGEDTKLFFVSFRGELARQLQINKMLIQEKALTPAAFSLSVFNAPIALATIALGLTGGYSAVYPGGSTPFATGLTAAKAAVLCGTPREIVFVYADELIPPEYREIADELPPPLAFGFVLSREPEPLAVPLSSFGEDGAAGPPDFLKKLILCGAVHAPA